MEKIIDLSNQTILNTLIVSLPGRGKTTLIRDITRNISNGTKDLKGQTVCIIDERGEIAASYKGIPQNDVGMRTDVLSNVSKDTGIKMAIRSMAPKIIVVDEIGKEEDIKALHYAICSGIKVICTAHGNNLEGLKYNKYLGEMIKLNFFNKIIAIRLNNGIIKTEILQ